MCLLESSFKDLVKMHGVIRDMAFWIDRTEKEYILMVEGMAINDRLMVECEKAKWISLWDVNSIDSNCSRTYSNLPTLLLSHHRLLLHPFTFPRGFFHCMSFIKVLDFQNSGLMSVPKEICNLVSLQHLNFSFTLIQTLPIELKNVRNLRSLHLVSIKNHSLIP